MENTPQIMEENGKRYRMLQVGETIEEGDEVNALTYSNRREWMLFLPPFGSQINSSQNGAMPVGYYRRPIQ